MVKIKTSRSSSPELANNSPYQQHRSRAAAHAVTGGEAAVTTTTTPRHRVRRQADAAADAAADATAATHHHELQPCGPEVLADLRSVRLRAPLDALAAPLEARTNNDVRGELQKVIDEQDQPNAGLVATARANAARNAVDAITVAIAQGRLPLNPTALDVVYGLSYHDTLSPELANVYRALQCMLCCAHNTKDHMTHVEEDQREHARREKNESRVAGRFAPSKPTLKLVEAWNTAKRSVRRSDQALHQEFTETLVFNCVPATEMNPDMTSDKANKAGIIEYVKLQPHLLEQLRYVDVAHSRSPAGAGAARRVAEKKPVSRRSARKEVVVTTDPIAREEVRTAATAAATAFATAEATAFAMAEAMATAATATVLSHSDTSGLPLQATEVTVHTAASAFAPSAYAPYPMMPSLEAGVPLHPPLLSNSNSSSFPFIGADVGYGGVDMLADRFSMVAHATTISAMSPSSSPSLDYDAIASYRSPPTSPYSVSSGDASDGASSSGAQTPISPHWDGLPDVGMPSLTIASLSAALDVHSPVARLLDAESTVFSFYTIPSSRATSSNFSIIEDRFDNYLRASRS